LKNRTRVLYSAIFLCLIGACSSSSSIDGPGAQDRAAQAVDLGRVSGDATLDFVVGLQLRQATQMHKLLATAPSGERIWSPQEFGDRFGASRASYDATVRWFVDHGITVVSTSPSRTTLTLTASAARVEAAFAVELHLFRDAAGEFIAPTRPLAMPFEIASSISGTIGLHGDPAWRSYRRPPEAMPRTFDTSQSPSDLQSLYGYDQTVGKPGQGQSVAILGAGLPPDPVKDVQGFVTRFQLPTNVSQQYQQIFVGGPNRDTDPALTQGEYGENCLDIDMVLAMAPYANVYHVLSATNTAMFVDGISYVVNQLPMVHSVTVSFGICERFASNGMPILNALLAQAKAQGQQWFFASGDAGTDGCLDGSGNVVTSVSWPASSPYAIGVGGTALVSGTGLATVARAWGGSGGGPSEAIDKPAFQMGVTPTDSARDTPDVAAIAGRPGVDTVTGGVNADMVGGTSAAAPIWAGIWAVIDQYQQGNKAHTGLPTGLETLYTLGKAGKGFVDVTTYMNVGPGGGTNGFPAGPGYDLVTGWGTPNVAQLIANWPQ
jgi:kumamolisin